MHGPSTARTRRTWAVGHRSSGCSRCGCCVRCASTVRKEPVRGPVSCLRHADRPGPALPYGRAGRRLRAPRWYASAASGSEAMPSPRALIGAYLRSGVRVGPAWGPRRTEVTAGLQCIPVGPTQESRAGGRRTADVPKAPGCPRRSPPALGGRTVGRAFTPQAEVRGRSACEGEGSDTARTLSAIGPAGAVTASIRTPNGARVRAAGGPVARVAEQERGAGMCERCAPVTGGLVGPWPRPPARCSYGRISSQVPAVICQDVRCGPRCGRCTQSTSAGRCPQRAEREWPPR